MIKIKLALYGNFEITGDIEMFVERKFSWNSKITLNFIQDSVSILKCSYYPWPFCRIRIQHLDLADEILLTHKDKSLIIGTDIITIEPVIWFAITKKIQHVFINGVKKSTVFITKNSTEGVELESDFSDLKYSLKRYAIILIILNCADIDGGE